MKMNSESYIVLISSLAQSSYFELEKNESK